MRNWRVARRRRARASRSRSAGVSGEPWSGLPAPGTASVTEGDSVAPGCGRGGSTPPRLSKWELMSPGAAKAHDDEPHNEDAQGHDEQPDPRGGSSPAWLS